MQPQHAPCPRFPTSSPRGKSGLHIHSMREVVEGVVRIALIAADLSDVADVASPACLVHRRDETLE